MVLTVQQKQALNQAIAQYLKSEGLQETLSVFQREAVVLLPEENAVSIFNRGMT